jgi:hypothetical protein
MENNLKAEIRKQSQRRESTKEDITTFDQKRALVLQPIHEITGRQRDGSECMDIRNELELGTIQAVLVYFYSFHQIIYEDVDSDQPRDRECERYEELQKTYIEQAKLMSERAGEVLPDTLIETMTVPYTPPQTKTKNLKVVRAFFKRCFLDTGMEEARAETNIRKLMDIFKCHAKALHIDHSLQALFEFDILAPILIREKEFGINLTKYFTFKS